MLETTFTLLLLSHITSGFTALLCSFGAMLCNKGQYWHRLFGKFFFYSMTGIFITAIPLAIIKSNLFLFLIAIFSYYLTFTGWRYAKNRTGIPTITDRIINLIMIFISIIMFAIAIHNFKSNINQAITLLVFAIIGSVFALTDFQAFRRKDAIGKLRIAKHLGAMLGATIAALTAFSVTNLSLHPVLLLWLGPTILISPVIAWWKFKVLKD